MSKKEIYNSQGTLFGASNKQKKAKIKAIHSTIRGTWLNRSFILGLLVFMAPLVYFVIEASADFGPPFQIGFVHIVITGLVVDLLILAFSKNSNLKKGILRGLLVCVWVIVAYFILINILFAGMKG